MLLGDRRCGAHMPAGKRAGVIDFRTPSPGA